MNNDIYNRADVGVHASRTEGTTDSNFLQVKLDENDKLNVMG